jgi:type II secretory pathway pseudopilin PulG
MLKMTNPATDQHHKILGLASSPSIGVAAAQFGRERSSERGYTIVALLAFMTIVAIFAMAAAPRMQQQAMREREKEAIFRGEQVADAIKQYYRYRRGTTGGIGDQALPTSMDQLLEGVPIPGAARNLMILRASAAIDPLSEDGEWRFIAPRSESLVEFQQSVILHAGNLLPMPRDQQMLQLQQLAAPQVIVMTNLGTTSNKSSGSSAGDTTGGPFVGVACNNSTKSVLTYYGIDSHDRWIFTPLFRSY